MGERIIRTVFDDVTGQPGEDIEQESFVFRGTLYRLDLSKASRTNLETALAPFTDAAPEKTEGVTVMTPADIEASTRKPRGNRAETAERLKTIREWAAGKGLDVSDRGRVPAEVVKAYEEAHASTDTGPTTAPESKPPAKSTAKTTAKR